MSYPPKIFTSEDWTKALEVVSLVKFASIVVRQDILSEAIFAPFVVGKNNGDSIELFCHLLRTNPLFALSEHGSVPCLLIFNAADGYISPSVYEEKSISGKVVPTWNYVAAQFHGKLERIPDEQLLEALSIQVSDFETAVSSSWKLDDAPKTYIEKLAKSIFGIKFIASSCKVNHKLSQNNPNARIEILQWCRQLEYAHKTLPYWMKKIK